MGGSERLKILAARGMRQHDSEVSDSKLPGGHSSLIFHLLVKIFKYLVCNRLFSPSRGMGDLLKKNFSKFLAQVLQYSSYVYKHN